jgi:hypothetical protein
MNAIDYLSVFLDNSNGLVTKKAALAKLLPTTVSEVADNESMQIMIILSRIWSIRVNWRNGGLDALQDGIAKAVVKHAKYVQASTTIASLTKGLTAIPLVGELVASSYSSADVQISAAIGTLQEFLQVMNDNEVPDVLYGTKEDPISAKLGETFAGAMSYLRGVNPPNYVIPAAKAFSTLEQETLFDRVSLVNNIAGNFSVFANILTGATPVQNTQFGHSVSNAAGLEAFQESTSPTFAYSASLTDKSVGYSIVNRTHSSSNVKGKYVLGSVRVAAPTVHGSQPLSNSSWKVTYSALASSPTGSSLLAAVNGNFVGYLLISPTNDSDDTDAVIREFQMEIVDGYGETYIDNVFFKSTVAYIFPVITTFAISILATAISHGFYFHMLNSESVPNDITTEHSFEVFGADGSLMNVFSSSLSNVYNRLLVIPSSTRAGFLQHLHVQFDQLHVKDWQETIRIIFDTPSSELILTGWKYISRTTWEKDELREYLAGGITRWLQARTDLDDLTYEDFYAWLESVIARHTASALMVKTDVLAARRYYSTKSV